MKPSHCKNRQTRNLCWDWCERPGGAGVGSLGCPNPMYQGLDSPRPWTLKIATDLHLTSHIRLNKDFSRRKRVKIITKHEILINNIGIVKIIGFIDCFCCPRQIVYFDYFYLQKKERKVFSKFETKFHPMPQPPGSMTTGARTPWL